MRYFAMLAAALGMVLCGLTGCESLNTEEGGLFAQTAYEPSYVLSFHDEIKYPRGSRLEVLARSMDGRQTWYNKNQSFSSEHIEDAKVVPIPGKPERCKVMLKMTRTGKLAWQMAYQNVKTHPMLVMLDGIWVGYFNPDTATGIEQNWFELNTEFDSVVAQGIASHAKKNYEFYNPNANGWF